MKATLLRSEALDAPVAIDGVALELWAYSAASPDHPERNEDAAGVWPLDDGSLVLAVADGMGGTPAGAEAASLAIAQLDEALGRRDPTQSLRTTLLDAFERANRAVLEAHPGSGTTLVVCELAEGCVRAYNVGDSAAMVVGQRGRIRLETIAHSPVGYAVAAGMLDPDQALEHEERHFVSNQVGSESMHLELSSRIETKTLDTLLLASDGLLDNLSPSEIVETIRCGPLGEAAARLARQCGERMSEEGLADGGKADDVTFLLARGRRQ